MTSSMIEKWGGPVAERGFAQIPNYLLNLNQFLDPSRRLGSLELLVLIQLVATWWKRDELPFPSMRTLGVRCGASERQVQRTIKHLEEIGLVQRVKRGEGLMTSNAYNLLPLVAVLSRIPQHFPNMRPRNLTMLGGEKPTKVKVRRKTGIGRRRLQPSTKSSA